MVERTRALKRHHDARIKVKRTRYVNDSISSTVTPQKPSDKIVGRVTCTPKNCSCYMCGNPRKHTGELTLQEKSALEIEKFSDCSSQNPDVHN